MYVAVDFQGSNKIAESAEFLGMLSEVESCF